MQVKDRVLEALEANRGTYFSGEALAQKLAVSRSAVWKAIQQLRESGYPIEAASKRGYCLAKDSAILSAQSIAQYLTVPRLRLEVEQLVSSTTTLLRQRAAAGEPEGLALVAAAQTAMVRMNWILLILPPRFLWPRWGGGTATVPQGCRPSRG